MNTRSIKRQDARLEPTNTRRCPVIRIAHWLEELFRDFAWNG